MKTTLLLSLLCFSLSAYAQKAKLTVIDPELDASELSQDFDVNRPIQQETFLPDRQEREEFFRGVKAAKDWDELQKDIFFVELQKKDVSTLAKKYPELSVQELNKLKARIKK